MALFLKEKCLKDWKKLKNNYSNVCPKIKTSISKKRQTDDWENRENIKHRGNMAEYRLKI